LKEALVSLRKLEEDYVAVANRLAEAMSANLRREMTELAAHAQNLGVEASVRVASMMGEFASSMGAGSGLATVRGASARMAMLASGVLAGLRMHCATIPRRRRANSNRWSPGCSARPASCRACVRSAWSSCGMGSETSCVALASLRCSSTQDMY